MPELKSYEEMKIEMIEASPNPAAKVGLALSITMKQDPESTIHPVSKKKSKYLLDAEHSSVFEHVIYTFLIQNVSRSFLAQITRQRTASPTSGSQHYQDYEDYDCMVHEDMLGDFPRLAIEDSVGAYAHLTENGCPKEEARQVLPNACATNYLWTIDARNLMFFLRQRCCNRNVTEMRIFANRVLSLVEEHFPSLFKNVGPQCFMDKAYGGCKQGPMACSETYWKKIG